MNKLSSETIDDYEILPLDCLDGLKQIEDGAVKTVITSPPYWGLRDYDNDNQLGQEDTPEEYVSNLVAVFREIRRVLADDGTVWLNLGDSYVGTGHKGNYTDPKYSNGRTGQKIALNNKVEGLKPKDLIGIPWRVAFALQADGWYLRQDIIWAKPNAMPEPVKDRCTKSHEYIFLLSKSKKYFYNSEAIREEQSPSTVKDIASRKNMDNKGTHGDVRADLARDRREYVPADGKRNKRDVWLIPTKPYKGAHFAVMPEAIVEPCVLAGSEVGDLVLDPFSGSGTVGVVSLRYGRKYLGIEINKSYVKLSIERIENNKENK